MQQQRPPPPQQRRPTSEQAMSAETTVGTRETKTRGINSEHLIRKLPSSFGDAPIVCENLERVPFFGLRQNFASSETHPPDLPGIRCLQSLLERGGEGGREEFGSKVKRKGDESRWRISLHPFPGLSGEGRVRKENSLGNLLDIVAKTAKEGFTHNV